MSGSEDSKVYFWNLVDSEAAFSLSEHKAPVFCIRCFEEFVVTAAADGIVKVWKADLAAAGKTRRSSNGLSAVGFKPATVGGTLPSSFGKKKPDAASVGAPVRRPACRDMPEEASEPPAKRRPSRDMPEEASLPPTTRVTSRDMPDETFPPLPPFSEAAAAATELDADGDADGAGDQKQVKKRKDRGRKDRKRKHLPAT
eukprot:TRINITY_DN70348_c0_g1_i2.p1 TRINITY_DN70348_c0_g1~~TRINITY_DN70348_c0_g1_i2.p1  ORF type:complete len:199 (-),score=51.57 TRINITY_DN70348_c0_g1_i2:36-632(-)